MNKTFTKRLADGRTAHVVPFITAFGDVSYDAVDSDGRKIVSGWLQEAAERGVSPERRPDGCTHLIGGCPPLWFTGEEAAALAALGEEAKAAFDASEQGRQLAAWRHQLEVDRKTAAARTSILRSSEGEALVRQREGLKAAVQARLDADEDQRARAHDDEGGDPGSYYRVQQPQNDAAYEEALAALEAFDAAHPEIAAALREEREASLQRFLDTD
ncbi:hypothetical protein ACFV3R_11020 [Streptomyces sp. NPDC059740]|uniref:hypothetical protein n=1 Tax=Streptomyces sp. NPDC059740 TaxID=3346926 RepID=UPI003657A94C